MENIPKLKSTVTQFLLLPPQIHATLFLLLTGTSNQFHLLNSVQNLLFSFSLSAICAASVHHCCRPSPFGAPSKSSTSQLPPSIFFHAIFPKSRRHLLSPELSIRRRGSVVVVPVAHNTIALCCCCCSEFVEQPRSAIAVVSPPRSSHHCRDRRRCTVGVSSAAAAVLFLPSSLGLSLFLLSVGSLNLGNKRS